MKAQRLANMSGFTLLEVLVSTVLLASAFVAVMAVCSQSLRNFSRIEPHKVALAHAREKTNDLLMLEELKPGTSAGSWDDGYRWQASIASSAPDAKSSGPGYGLFNIRVMISWGDPSTQRSYAVETTQWAKKATSDASR